VLTQEDWNEVLYNGMQKTSSWAALYFIALMTFGNYVLFNLLVAILVEGFSTEDEPKKSIEDRIREDALQAIAEETLGKDNNMTKSTSHTSKYDSHRRQSPRSLKHSNNSINSRTSSVRGKKELSELTKTSDKEEGVLVCFNRHSDTTKSSFKSNETPNQMRLPIITHTCPTPAQTPKNASLTSLQEVTTPNISMRKSNHYGKTYDKSKYGQIKKRFSFDSATERIKLNFNSKRSKSTHTHIFITNIGQVINSSMKNKKASTLNEPCSVNNLKTRLSTASNKNQQLPDTASGKYLDQKQAVNSFSTIGSSLTPPSPTAFLRRSKRSNSEKIVRKHRDIGDSSLNFDHQTFTNMEPFKNLANANGELQINKRIDSIKCQDSSDKKTEINKTKQTTINQNDEIIVSRILFLFIPF
jgi:hypothetical protein